ncbi:TadE family protein [Tessaracoccus sp. MC1756]|uniref:TadE family protein n=1 Tax=Tessaracoccus sp. MC1756 TaxID=2760311 RepID=UPI0015FF6F7E|nr:TadE family protein [Tessaracoccus sp. MC1756]MBB1509472.1 pilus assembly protein [Tessaracoccus sp. MC1756]
MKSKLDRGAAAVEFAIVAMLLVTLLMGIMEFGYAFFVQGNIAGAAREAARAYAIDPAGTDVSDVAADYGMPSGATVALEPPAGCSPGGPVTVTITYTYSGLTGFFGGLDLTGEGTMRCGG